MTKEQKREIVQLIGLRRVGKTTLFFQLIDFLAKKITPFHIWYFTFDEEKLKLEDLLSAFVTQTDLDFRKEKIFVFLDEIQKLKHFQESLKVYFDLYPNLKFFLSGSTSLFVKKKSQESLAGRIRSFWLPPLDFEEFLYFKNKTFLIKKPRAFFRQIYEEFDLYLKSQFPETVFMASGGEKNNKI